MPSLSSPCPSSSPMVFLKPSSADCLDPRLAWWGNSLSRSPGTTSPARWRRALQVTLTAARSRRLQMFFKMRLNSSSGMSPKHAPLQLEAVVKGCGVFQAQRSSKGVDWHCVDEKPSRASDGGGRGGGEGRGRNCSTWQRSRAPWAEREARHWTEAPGRQRPGCTSTITTMVIIIIIIIIIILIIINTSTSTITITSTIIIVVVAIIIVIAIAIATPIATLIAITIIMTAKMLGPQLSRHPPPPPPPRPPGQT